MILQPIKFKWTAFFLLGICFVGLAKNRVKKGDFFQTVILTGSLKAQKAEHFAVPRTKSWQIQIKWMAREGDPVKPGDPVVRFDTSNLVSEIENVELSLQDKLEQRTQKLAECTHEKLELELKLKQAEIEYEKIKLDTAIPKGIVSNHDYDRNQLEMKKSAEALKKARLEKQVKMAAMESEIKRLEIDIEEERAKLEKNKKTLQSLTLVAKTAGTMVYAEHPWQEGRKIQVGDNVWAAMTVATIPDNNSLQVEAWVNETNINRVKPGQKVDIIMDAYPDKQYTGTIKDVLNSAEKRNQWGKAHYFMVLIELDSRELTIMKPGMSVRCLIHAAEYPQVKLIPLEMAYFDNGSFWIKPQGKEVLKVKHLGFNEFYLALSSSNQKKIKEGSLLEPVVPSEIKEKNSEQK